VGTMKKVLILSLAYYPRVGGAEVAIKEITDRISDMEFHMITLRFGSEPKEEKMGNVWVHRVGFGGAYLSKMLFIPLAALKARTLHAAVKFDGAWAMMSYMTLPMALARMMGVKIPYVLNLQDGDPFEHVFGRWFVAPLKPLFRYGFKHAAVVQVLSNYLAGWARTLGFTGQIELIPNGVDTAKFVGEPLAHEGKVLVTTSRLVHKNAVDTVLKALPALPDVRFDILGSGPEEEKLKKLAKHLDVSDRVKFLGYVPHEDMPKYLHASDIFIRPSRSEGQGASFIEAMAAGLPVIATQEGGIADFLFDKVRNPDKPTTGWAVDVDSPDQIVQAVKAILSDPEATKRVIENAKKMALEHYSWDLIARDMRAKVLDKLG
jgi:glycosyltransferase involved in cell wall biosynthesis